MIIWKDWSILDICISRKRRCVSWCQYSHCVRNRFKAISRIFLISLGKDMIMKGSWNSSPTHLWKCLMSISGMKASLSIWSPVYMILFQNRGSRRWQKLLLFNWSSWIKRCMVTRRCAGLCCTALHPLLHQCFQIACWKRPTMHYSNSRHFLWNILGMTFPRWGCFARNCLLPQLRPISMVYCHTMARRLYLRSIHRLSALCRRKEEPKWRRLIRMESPHGRIFSSCLMRDWMRRLVRLSSQ